MTLYFKMPGVSCGEREGASILSNISECWTKDDQTGCMEFNTV